MRASRTISAIAIGFAVVLTAGAAGAQSTANLNALQGLAPVSTLDNSAAGHVALARNLRITAAIQDGSAHQPTLLPFSEQQQQALRDAFMTAGNASGLADGLGTRLEDAYLSKASYQSTDDGKDYTFTSVSPGIAQLIAYAYATTSADAGSGKFFFANETTDGKTQVSAAAIAIMTDSKGVTDIFGKAYSRPAGSDGADPYGNSRPFQTEPHLTTIAGKDFFGVDSTNIVYLRGPTQDLTANPSYPSGHTTYGYAEGLLLALLVPQRYPEMIARAAEYGNDRIILGAHYTMDVLGGRTLALYDIAQLLANKAGYAGVSGGKAEIDDFPKALAAARAELTKFLETTCGDTIAACAHQDKGRFANQAKNLRFYEATQTYGLPVVFKRNARGSEDVGKLAPEAGYLLTAAFPYLSLCQADAILTATEGPGGGFLDDGSAFGVYSRLDLYKAAERAIALAPKASGGLGAKVTDSKRRRFAPARRHSMHAERSANRHESCAG